MNHVYTKLSTIRDVGVVKSPLTRRLGIVISLCFLSFYLVIIFQTDLVQNKGITDGEETEFILGTIHESFKENYAHFNAQQSLFPTSCLISVQFYPSILRKTQFVTFNHKQLHFSISSHLRGAIDQN